MWRAVVGLGGDGRSNAVENAPKAQQFVVPHQIVERVWSKSWAGDRSNREEVSQT